jgi:haloalkane dehalogenase
MRLTVSNNSWTTFSRSLIRLTSTRSYRSHTTPWAKARYSSFLGPVIDDNFRKHGSGPAFAQMTSQLKEEVARNTVRYPKAEALDMPVKIIWGERDPYLNSGVAEVLRSHLKHASLTFLPAGHRVQIDVPEQVAAIMLGGA